MQRKQDAAIRRRQMAKENIAPRQKPHLVEAVSVRMWNWQQNEWGNWTTGYVRNSTRTA